MPPLRLNRVAAGSAVAAAVVISGCGGSKDYANDPRPPAPINVAAAISPDGVTVDPRSFGGGPVTMLIANLTAKAQKLTVRAGTRGTAEPGLRQTSSSINPQGTATLKVDMKPGAYTVSVGNGEIKPAHVRVGKPRASSRDQLLQP